MNEINDLPAEVAKALARQLAAAVPDDHREKMAGKLMTRLAEEALSKGALGKGAQETAASLHSKFYVSEGGSKDPSQWLSDHWKKTEALYCDLKGVLIERCRRDGLSHFPAIVKSNGAKGSKLYYMSAQELPEVPQREAQQRAAGEADAQCREAEADPPGALRYKKDMEPQLSSLGKLVFGAGRLLTLRRRVSIAVPPILVVILTLWVNWKIAVAFLATNRPIYPSDVVLAVVVVVAPYVAFKWMSRLMDLMSLRYQAAPDWATGMKEMCAVLELEDIDRGEGSAKVVKVSRYTALCGVCGHTVYLKDGNKQFGRRVVGCCSASPDEHVFTFDPRTSLGYPLRQRKGGYVGQ